MKNPEKSTHLQALGWPELIGQKKMAARVTPEMVTAAAPRQNDRRPNGLRWLSWVFSGRDGRGMRYGGLN
ncbi:MAG TPA: hypothetical protein VJ654_19955 [Noviherbaspirillum sp.]|nr:hypothetical protein [Noviherbaspirillum sp.]